MAAQKGRDILVKVWDGGAYISVGGLRTKSISLNAEMVDISDSDSTGQYRELLAGAGIKSVSISGEGVFKDSAGENRIRTLWFSSLIENFEMTIPGLGVLTGAFQVTTMDYAGEYNKEVTFSQTYESAGNITFTPS